MTNPAAAAILAQFEATAAELDAAALTANGLILAWPTGLGIRWEKGEPVVCGVLHADPVRDGDLCPTIVNGLRETARLTDRKAALEAAAASARESIAFITELAA